MPFLIIMVTICIIYLLLRNKNTPQVSASARPPGEKHLLAAPLAEPVFHWSDGGRYQTEVVAESVYNNTIRALAGEHGDQNVNLRQRAILLPDDDYPHDDKAVAVFIEGRLVGYLAREDALRLRRKAARKELSATAPTSCDSAIRGGALWNGKRLSYAIWLDIEPFD